MAEEVSIETQLRQLYELLQTGEDDKVQQANEVLAEFCQNPESIEIWLNFYANESTNPLKMYGVVLLSTSIRKVWTELNDEAKESLFQRFLEYLASEEEWSIRQNLIWIVQRTMLPEFNDILLSFVTSASGSEDERALQISFLLAALLPLASEKIGELYIGLLNRGFSSDVEETRLEAFSFLLYWNGFQYIDDIDLPGYWEQIIETIPYFFENELHNWQRLTKVLIFAFEQRTSFTLTSLPVLEKCMEVFEPSDDVDVDRLLPLCYVIESICSAYPEEVLESGAFPQIFELCVSVSGQLFESSDCLALSNANFFEQTFTYLCKEPDALDALWTSCMEITDSIEGMFVFVCSLAATIQNLPVFFRDRVDVITEALVTGISSDSDLLRDAAARTANVVVGFFGNESEIAQNLIEVVFEACTQTVTADLLLVFTALLDTTKDSEDIFDTAFEFLVEIVIQAPPDIQAAALAALTSLALGSTVRITVHFESLFSLLNEILYSEDPDVVDLKANAMNCLSKVAGLLGEIFDDHVIEVITFCMENIDSEDRAFGISCFTSIEHIISTHQETAMPIADDVMEAMHEFASEQVFEEYRSDVVSMMTENGEEDMNEIETESRFMASAVALRIMSLIVKMDHDFCYKYAMIVIQCCESQNASVVNVLKSSAAFAVGNLAEALVSCMYDQNPPLQSIPVRMGQVILGIIKDANIENLSDNEAGLLMDGFTAAAKVVEWLDYDCLGPSIKPILDIAYKLLSEVAMYPSYTVRTRDLIEGVYSFVNMVVTSAELKSPILLHEFLPLFVEFAEHSDPLFKSIALRFFGEIIISASSELDSEFKENCKELALTSITEENLRFGFSVLKALALNDQELARSTAETVYQVCMDTLSQSLSKSENFLLTRDVCVSTFAAYALHIFGDDVDLDECLPVVLDALPLVMDFSETGLITDFIKWGYERAPHLGSHFIRPLIVQFANPPAVVAHLGLSEKDKSDLLDILKLLIESCEDSEEIILSALDSDMDKKACLELYL